MTKEKKPNILPHWNWKGRQSNYLHHCGLTAQQHNIPCSMDMQYLFKMFHYLK
ncbi:hypothetical protein [Flavobacterium flavigenum]|uniref:hypothetical protein n=1 Tax=Flavobacterium flavigenum TaxID=3003258 RepID=UPI0022AC793E|nr:hypothetical protein [Flavobacterium flavigenum]